MIGLVRRRPFAAALVVWCATEPALLQAQDARRCLVMGLLASLPLFVADRMPVTAAAWTATAVSLQLALEAIPGRSVGTLLCLVAVLYAATTRGPLVRRAPVPAVLVGAALLASGHVLAATGTGLWPYVSTSFHVFISGLVAGAILLGWALRDRTDRAVAARARVRSLQARLACISADAVWTERREIAHGLESIVEGVVATMPLEDAAVGRRAQAVAALDEARATAKRALAEVHELLRVLHADGGAPPEAPPMGQTRAARRVALVAPWLLLALFGVAEQILLPARPLLLEPGVEVPGAPYPLGVVIALCVLTPLPLMLRRRAPLAAIALLGALLCTRTAVADLSSLTWSQHFLGLGAAFVAGAFIRDRRRSAAGLLLATAICTTCWIFEQLVMIPAEWAYLAALLAAAYTTGRAVARQITIADDLAIELADLRTAERTLRREITAFERRRVARQVHDLVGHGLSLLSMQSAVAAGRLAAGQDAPADALATVRRLAETTRDELVELQRRLLGDSRHPETAPDGIPELVSAAQRHGQDVVLVGDCDALPPSAATVLADVVRESLTNCRKHAQGARTLVTVGVDERIAELQVRNSAGTTAGLPSGSTGLEGLAGHVEEHGGQLSSGATDDGGWQVTCAVPLAVAPSVRAPSARRRGGSTGAGLRPSSAAR